MYVKVLTVSLSKHYHWFLAIVLKVLTNGGDPKDWCFLKSYMNVIM